MTRDQAMDSLAEAMEGEVGRALRLYLGLKTEAEEHALYCEREHTEIVRQVGRISVLRDIAGELGAARSTTKLVKDMREQRDKA